MALLLRSRCILAALSTRRFNVPAVVRIPSVRWASSNKTDSPSSGTSTAPSGGKPEIPSPPQEKGKKRLSPISWETLALTTGLMAVLLLILKVGRDQKRKELKLDKVKSMGKAAIGGDFELIDHNSKRVSSKDFRGKWMLIYFGFTHCPDICPEELEKMAAVIKAIDEKLGPQCLQPLFISVDPERDTPVAIGKYAADFSPRLLGLTGTMDDIKDVCKKFRIYHSAGPKESDDDYIVDHTIITYLMNPEGEFANYFSQNKKKDEIVNSILDHMDKYRVLNEVFKK